MTAVEQALAEITERLATFAPIHEGLRDFASLDLKPDTKTEIEVSIVLYDNRKRLLDAAKSSLEALMQDGHPDLSVREISAAAFDDLRENTSTIEAAMARFASNAATGMALAPGEKELKP